MAGKVLCAFHQDAALHATLLEPGRTVAHTLGEGRHAWVQMARGRARLNGTALAEGDGVAVSRVTRLEITADLPAGILLFDLA
ncbi:MAG: hypothetical protein ACE5HD_11835 [Acidobacteriota bacterium]